jgi:hypothetical protein
VARHYSAEPLAIHGQRLGESERRRIDAEVESAIAELVAEAKSTP